MLKNLTIGSYYPVESVIHRLDPRVKLVSVLVFLVSLFLFSNFAGYLVVTLMLLVAIALSGVPITYMLKGLRAIIFLLLVTAFFNIFFTKSGTILWEWHFIRITDTGLRNALFMAMRLFYLVLGSSMLTYTTTPGALTEAIESLLKPLTWLHVPVHDFAMMMSLALRFIPLLVLEANRIIDAQSARGADFENGKIIKRMKAFVSILVPLLISATRRAYDLGLAMESRCYNCGKKRTKMKKLHHRAVDVFVYPLMILYVAGIIVVGRL